MEEFAKSSDLILKDRGMLSVSGVINILGFDSYAVTLETKLGKLTAEGEDLKIESLNKASGELTLRGRISGLYYTDEKITKGVFKGIFK